MHVLAASSEQGGPRWHGHMVLSVSPAQGCVAGSSRLPPLHQGLQRSDHNQTLAGALQEACQSQ